MGRGSKALLAAPPARDPLTAKDSRQLSTPERDQISTDAWVPDALARYRDLLPLSKREIGMQHSGYGFHTICPR